MNLCSFSYVIVQVNFLDWIESQNLYIWQSVVISTYVLNVATVEHMGRQAYRLSGYRLIADRAPIGADRPFEQLTAATLVLCRPIGRCVADRCPIACWKADGILYL